MHLHIIYITLAELQETLRNKTATLKNVNKHYQTLFLFTFFNALFYIFQNIF